MPQRALAVVCLGMALAVAAGCSPGCSREAPHPNLLLVTVDTLRADRLGFAGHSRETSPAIDRLARESVRFSRSYSQSGWTLPSLASVLTGHYPSRHGAVDFGSGVDRSLPTLAMLLAARGYDTHAFVSHVLLRPEYGLARGFGQYDGTVLRVGHPHEVSTAAPLTEKAIRALSEAEPPFFLWVHYFDPHFNYLRHRRWAGFGDGLIDRYDQEIAYTDRHVGKLLEALDASGHAAQTVVVLTADHGEAFGELDMRFHFNLDEPVARIPLVIRAPGLAPGDRDALAQQVDFLPTMLALLGFSAPDGLPGRDLLATTDEEPAVFMERSEPYLQRSVIRGRYKLSVHRQIEGKEIPTLPGLTIRTGTFLHDLEADPAESTNLYESKPEVAAELIALLRDEFGDELGGVDGTGTDVEVDPELAEQLQALGYAP